MSKWLIDIHGEIEGDYELICKAENIISLDKVKKAREEIEEYKTRQLTLAMGVEDLEKGKQVALDYVITILDKLIESEEE